MVTRKGIRMIKKVLLSLLLVGIVGTPDVCAMKRARSKPIKLSAKTQKQEDKKKDDTEDTENKRPTKKQKHGKKDEKEGKLAHESKPVELQEAVLTDNITKFKELVGIQPSIDSAITVGNTASTLLHAVVYAYTLKGSSCSGKPPVYCPDVEEAENNLIEWFMLLIYFNVDFSAQDGEDRTAAQLATLKAKQYLKSNARRSKAMAPEELEFVAMLEKIPELMGQAYERYDSLTTKQRPDSELREYFGLVKIEDFINKFVSKDGV